MLATTPTHTHKWAVHCRSDWFSINSMRSQNKSRQNAPIILCCVPIERVVGELNMQENDGECSVSAAVQSKNWFRADCAWGDFVSPQPPPSERKNEHPQAGKRHNVQNAMLLLLKWPWLKECFDGLHFQLAINGWWQHQHWVREATGKRVNDVAHQLSLSAAHHNILVLHIFIIILFFFLHSCNAQQNLVLFFENMQICLPSIRSDFMDSLMLLWILVPNESGACIIHSKPPLDKFDSDTSILLLFGADGRQWSGTSHSMPLLRFNSITGDWNGAIICDSSSSHAYRFSTHQYASTPRSHKRRTQFTERTMSHPHWFLCGCGRKSWFIIEFDCGAMVGHLALRALNTIEVVCLK